MSRYGGKKTVIKDLPVGTKFFVHNGHWHGEVIELNGEKHVLIEGDVFENALKIPDDKTLSITIEEGD